MKKITEEQKEEIKESYDGTWGSIVMLANRFSVDNTQIRYIVNNKGRRRKQIKASLNWRKHNRDKYNEYMKNFYKKNANTTAPQAS